MVRGRGIEHGRAQDKVGALAYVVEVKTRGLQVERIASLKEGLLRLAQIPRVFQLANQLLLLIVEVLELLAEPEQLKLELPLTRVLTCSGAFSHAGFFEAIRLD